MKAKKKKIIGEDDDDKRKEISLKSRLVKLSKKIVSRKLTFAKVVGLMKNFSQQNFFLNDETFLKIITKPLSLSIYEIRSVDVSYLRLSVKCCVNVTKRNGLSRDVNVGLTLASQI